MSEILPEVAPRRELARSGLSCSTACERELTSLSRVELTVRLRLPSTSLRSAQQSPHAMGGGGGRVGGRGGGRGGGQGGGRGGGDRVRVCRTLPKAPKASEGPRAMSGPRPPPTRGFGSDHATHSASTSARLRTVTLLAPATKVPSRGSSRTCRFVSAGCSKSLIDLSHRDREAR